MVTVIGVSYDGGGTRHVRRVDLRRESFVRFAMFVDSFPTTTAYDGTVLAGRVHSNASWRSTGTPTPVYPDTVTAVSGLAGMGTYHGDTTHAAWPIRYPRDSTFAWMQTLAESGELDVTPRVGGSRLEFVALDADGDSIVEEHEGFVRVFDLATASGADTIRLRVSPPVRTDCTLILGLFCSGNYYDYLSWDDDIVQNQCGAFYLRSGRWHFVPIATHRATWAASLIVGTGSANYPQVNPGTAINSLNDYDFDALAYLLANIETVRCFPAGSPYLMLTERFTNAAGVVTNTSADVYPFGSAPGFAWPGGTPYGGSDTTFSRTSRTCRIASNTNGWCEAGTVRTLGSWRAFAGTALSTIPTSVRQSEELPYLWPVDPALNPASRRVLSATSGPLFVSGQARGPVTLRVDGRITLVDRLRTWTDPNDPEVDACSDQLGLLATSDVVVVDGLTSRVRRFGRQATNFLGVQHIAQHTTAALTEEPRFSVSGHLMSTAGSVRVEDPNYTQGDASAQFPCPDDGGISSRSNGGCLAITGGMVMRTFTPPHGSTSNTGMRHRVAGARCQTADRRPPFFPLTNRYTLVRTLEIAANQANTPMRIRALLMRLKGRQL